MELLPIFAHAMTAQLWWHVQKFVMISCIFFVLKQNEYP